MSKVLTNNQYYSEIANVIREQNGTNNTYTPPQMVSALKDLFYEEVEGVPPISFQGIGENLLDYRIDGASGGVGERTKNFINSNKQVTYYNTTFKIEGSKVTLTGTPTGAGGRNSLCTDSILLSAGTYIFSNTNPNIGVQIVDESSNNSLSNPFTLTEEKNVHIGVYIKQSQVGTEFNEVDYWQLEEGSIATDYEPYGYKVPVVVSGKNLLPPIKEWESGYLNISGTVSSADVDRKEIASPFVKVNPNERYAFSFYPNEGNAWRCVGYYTANKEFVSRKFTLATSDPIIFTIPNNIEFIRLSYRTYGDGTYAQLEQNSEVTPYEAYIEPTTTNIYLDNPIDAKANIPSEYEEVEYIESTGTQYIDTGIKPNTGTTLFKGEFLVSSKSNVQGLFGCRNSGTAGSDSACVLYMTTGDLRLDWAKGDSTLKYAMATGTKFKIEISKNYAKIDDDDLTVGNTSEDVSLTRNFLIGNFYSGSNLFSSGLIGNIYSCKLFNNNVLVRDFIPCYRKSDNVAGLYDLVNNTFYTNQGTGNFIVGPIKENESISLSDTNVNIPTIRGTNVLTVNTTVQPSNVYVKSRHESSYETAMRERYEEAQAQLDALESGGE